MCDFAMRVCLDVFALLHIIIRLDLRQDGQPFVVFPRNADHAKIAESAKTPTALLVDTLALANRPQQVQLVQILGKLEQCQLSLGEVASLSDGEDKVFEVEETGLLKVEADKAKLAPSLAILDEHIKNFAAYMTSLPQAQLQQEPFAAYAFPNVVQQLNGLFEKVAHAAIDRWRDVCMTTIASIKDVFPEGWKAKCVTTFDMEWVKSKMLNKAVFENLGSDYQFLAMWLRSLDRCPVAKELFEKRWAEELAEIRSVSADSLSFASTILAYNVLIYKFPKLGSPERRQSIKDVTKKIRTKLGKEAEIPREVRDRMMAAISGK